MSNLARVETRHYATCGGRRTRPEVWEAKTVDGQWIIERIEERGTPWLVFHAPSGLLVSECSTLRNARLEVGNGTAELYLLAKAVSLLLTGAERTDPKAA